jgi:NAD(P)-dependent dehydrogenase (short-subunit alcohol dehydrogenase family)
MFDLTGKVAVVTGAGSGIGAATVRSLAGQGASVVAVDTNGSSITELVAALAASGYRAVGEKSDVRDEQACVRAIDRAASEYGRLDILVNNAGVGHVGNIEETDGEAFTEVMAVNVNGVANCSKAAISAMSAQNPQGGTIINVASVAGMIGLKRRFAYSASKGAVMAMTRQMAMDYVDRQIRVNAICPGTVDTPFVHSYLERFHPGEEQEEYEKVKLRQPLGRLGTAEEIAAAVVYLASDEASFATGSLFVIDGGLTAE